VLVAEEVVQKILVVQLIQDNLVVQVEVAMDMEQAHRVDLILKQVDLEQLVKEMMVVQEVLLAQEIIEVVAVVAQVKQERLVMQRDQIVEEQEKVVMDHQAQ
tara:strand:- start:231 stop:536 length:306 start_codon:yes stop_codon:yes gene_type:complete